MFNHPRHVSQATVKTLNRKAFVRKAQVDTQVIEVKAEVEVTLKEYSFKVMEYYDRCDLDYYRSSVTQAQLDSLHEHLHIPSAISMSALRRNVLP